MFRDLSHTMAPAAATSAPPVATGDSISAAKLYDALATQYLAYRRTYYQESEPQLATLPTETNHVYRTSIALFAEQAIRVIPPTIKSVPLIGELLLHLEDVADIHSFSNQERHDLTRLTTIVLRGLMNGPQSWFVDWYLAAARNMAKVADERYFLLYPWDGLLYLTPEELTLFEGAVRNNNQGLILRQVRQLVSRLIFALSEPVKIQPQLAFTGPQGRRNRAIFNIKTTLGLILGGLIAISTVRNLQNVNREEPQSLLPPLPPDI